jgi:hypothetical protein
VRTGSVTIADMEFIVIINIVTAIELSLGGSSSYTGTDKTNDKYTYM